MTIKAYRMMYRKSNKERKPKTEFTVEKGEKTE